MNLHLDECHTADEIGVLARAFEKTAEKLNGYMDYINALAYRDSLTGIKNLTAYNEMTSAIDVTIKTGDECEPFAILVADINCLKETNDLHGHEIGNRLIIRSAKIICDAFKHSPVYRIGGDEFVVLLRGEDFENYENLLLEMDEKAAKTIIPADEDEITVTIARAVAVFDGAVDFSFADVFNRADKLMYKNKRYLKSLAAGGAGED